MNALKEFHEHVKVKLGEFVLHVVNELPSSSASEEKKHEPSENREEARTI
jgi:hypothetical protein